MIPRRTGAVNAPVSQVRSTTTKTKRMPPVAPELSEITFLSAYRLCRLLPMPPLTPSSSAAPQEDVETTDAVRPVMGWPWARNRRRGSAASTEGVGATGTRLTSHLAEVASWWHKPVARRCLPSEIASLSETRALALIANTHLSALRAYHDVNLTRVYPRGLRVGSTNIPPATTLAVLQAGAQLVCFNYQRHDGGMQLNRGLFRLNGGCGYVLRQPLLAGRADDQAGGNPSPRIVAPPIAFQPPVAKGSLGICDPSVQPAAAAAAPASDHSGQRPASPGGVPVAASNPRQVWEAYMARGCLGPGRPSCLKVRILCGQHLHKYGEERIAPEIWDQFDPQRLLSAAPKPPSLTAASNVYCVLECWQGHAARWEPGSIPASADAEGRPDMGGSLAGSAIARSSLGESAALGSPGGSVDGHGLSCAEPTEPLTFTTRRVEGNGLNPTWDQGIAWELKHPNASFLRISVFQQKVGLLKDELLGYSVLPVGALRQGYRSVTGLRTAKGLRLSVAALLLHIRLEPLAQEHA